MKQKRIIKVLLILVLSISAMAGIMGAYAKKDKLEPLLQIENKKLDKTLVTAVKNSQELNTPENLKCVKSAMKSGSITFRFKFNNIVNSENTNVGRVDALLGISNNTTASQYAVLYTSRNVDGQENIGIEKRVAAGNVGVGNYNTVLKPGTLYNTDWHTLTYTFEEIGYSKSKVTIYCDGNTVAKSDADPNFFNSIKDSLNTVTLGGVDIGSSALKYASDGSVDMIQIHSKILNEKQIKDLHNLTSVANLPEMTTL